MEMEGNNTPASPLITCIYCPAKLNPTQGEGDHIIPAQLGEFRNDTRFRRICAACNSRIGHAEQQIVQSAPEGFFRSIVKPQSKRLRKRRSGPRCGAMGAPPPEYTIDMGNYRALVEPMETNPRDVRPVDHIFVRDKQDKETLVRLHPNIRPDQVLSALAKAGLGEMKDVRLNCVQERLPEYVQLLQKLWPKSKYEEGEPTPIGVRRNVPITITFVVNTEYFRAIAKIAFHYFLAHSSRAYRGDEDHFKHIRHFIMHGGESEGFFKQRSHRQFRLPFGDLASGGVVTPKQWCHFLAATELDGEALTYVRLFVGPGSLPPPHYVSLGHLPNRVITPRDVWGHVYLYDDPQKPGRSCGRVEAADITSFRLP
jgi:hypothetical protein